MSGPERVTGDRHADAVEADQLAGHVADGALDLGRGARPVGATQPVEARRVATQVSRDHPHLIARDEELVARRVFQDQVVALGAGERAMRDAGVAPHAVDPVDREVARLELIGDRVRPPAREPRRCPRVPPRTEEVLLGRDRELAGIEHEPVRERRLDGLQSGHLPDDLPHALERSVSARGDQQPVVARREVGQALSELGRVALRAPPVGQPEVEALREIGQMELHVLAERFVERANDVWARPPDRLGERLPLLEGLPRAVLRAAGLHQHDPRAVREQLGDRRHPIEQERRVRLGALDEQPIADPLQRVAEPIALELGATGRERTERVVGDQLAHRRREHPRDLRGGELRGRGELPERFDLVAQVLEPDRAPRVAREHVHHPSANGELAAVLDDVRTGVAELDQAFRQRVGRQIVSDDELERWDRTERRDQAVHRREHRGDEQERPARLPQPVDRVGPAGGDLRRRADAFVRQRLPRRQECDASLAEVGRPAGGERLRLARTGCDREDGCVERTRQPGDDRVRACVGVRDDRTGALEQEPLERLGRDQRIETLLQAHVPSTADDPDSTNRPRRVAAGPPPGVYRAGEDLEQVARHGRCGVRRSARSALARPRPGWPGPGAGTRAPRRRPPLA